MQNIIKLMYIKSIRESLKMSIPVIENHMVLDNDHLLSEEERISEEKILELASYVFEGSDLSEIIFDRSREDWLEFAYDRMTNKEFAINVFGFNVSEFVVSDKISDTRDSIIDDIADEMERHS